MASHHMEPPSQHSQGPMAGPLSRHHRKLLMMRIRRFSKYSAMIIVVVHALFVRLLLIIIYNRHYEIYYFYWLPRSSRVLHFNSFEYLQLVKPEHLDSFKNQHFTESQ